MNESRTRHLFLHLLIHSFTHSLTERQYHLDYKDTWPWPLLSELLHPQPGREILRGSATQWFPILRLHGAVHQQGMRGSLITRDQRQERQQRETQE